MTRPAIPRTGRQVEACERLEREYPPPMVVGWFCTPYDIVRGHIFATAEDDEAGLWIGEFSIYSDGEIEWWTRPAAVSGGAAEQEQT